MVNVATNETKMFIIFQLFAFNGHKFTFKVENPASNVSDASSSKKPFEDPI